MRRRHQQKIGNIKHLYIMKTVIFALLTWQLAAQELPVFRLELSSDSVLWGNQLQLSFTAENAPNAKFEAPDFPGFKVVAGPMTSTSYSSIQGVVKQSATYTYLLETRELGIFYIQPAALRLGDQVLETPPSRVMVVPNPDNIRQEIKDRDTKLNFRWSWDDFPGEPATPPAKKRATTRM